MNNNAEIGLSVGGGGNAPKSSKLRTITAVLVSLVVAIVMALSSRYSPLCDDFLVSFKFTPHFDSASKILIKPSFISVNKNFRGSFGTGCPVGTQKEITSDLECILKIPRGTVIDRLEFTFKDINGVFDISSIQLGNDRVPLNSIISAASDIKLGKDIKVVSGDLKDTVSLEVTPLGEEATLVVDKTLSMKGASGIRYGSILSILTIAVITYFISCQVFKFLLERQKVDETKVVVHYKSRQFMNIEILRFLLVMFVILEHNAGSFINISQQDFYFLDNFVNGGRSQLFFVIAGFFLFYSPKNLQTSPIFFIKKRWLRLSGLVIFTTIVGLAMYNFNTASNPIEDNLLTALLINLLKSSDIQYLVGPAWYVNNLFFLSCIYYAIFKTLEKKYALLITVGLAAISLNLYARGISLGLAGWGNMPGSVFSISVGILMAEAFKQISSNVLVQNEKQQGISYIAYSVFEIFIFVSLLIGLYGKHLGFNLGNNVMSGSIALMLWLFLIKKGVLSNFFNKSWAIYFGKYTYSIYVTHVIVLWMSGSFINSHAEFCIQHNILVPSAVIVAILIFAVFCHHIVEMPLSRWTAEKFLYKDSK